MLSGSRMMDSMLWNPAEADTTLYVDACLDGMGFSSTKAAMWAITHQTLLPHRYYFEALGALSALKHTICSFPNKCRFSIYSDSTNTVDIVSSLLRAPPVFNHILQAASDIIIHNNTNLHVLHIPGISNTIADAISRLNIATVLDTIPTFQLLYFQPPRFPLGALQKWAHHSRGLEGG
jgi:hypothetical protein